MEIRVLGAGCAKCKATYALFEQVIAAKGLNVKLIKVEDMAVIISYGIMSTPGVLVDNKLVMVGTVPTRQQIENWLIDT